MGKRLEKALKEAEVKCSEKSQKGEKTAKEVSKKGAEREEKLFTSEKDSKESAAKAISAANTREKVVYVPAAAPKIEASVPAPAPAKKAVKVAPAAKHFAAPEKFVCDAKNCKCVKSTNGQGDDFNYCTEMCSTSPGCAPVPAPPVPVPAPPLPRILTNEPVVHEQYVRYTPAPVPVAPVVPKTNDEITMKSQLQLKEGMMKSREKGQKAMAESGSKQSAEQMKLAAAELKQKSSESAFKEKASKHQTTQESLYKSSLCSRCTLHPAASSPHSNLWRGVPRRFVR